MDVITNSMDMTLSKLWEIVKDIFCSGCTNLHPHQQCTGVPFSVHSCHGFLPWLLLLFVVQSLSHVQLFATTWIVACQAALSITNSQSLLRFMFKFSIHLSNDYSGLISFRWTGWISLQSKGLSGVFSNTTVQKH